MNKQEPLVSIITVVYNGEKYLEETIQSIINQTYENIEYIIIDGGSTDGTLDIVKKYENKISYWVSEADKGIYDAMNKGIKVSNGEIIGIVNADDALYPNTVNYVQELMVSKSLDYTYGAVYLMDEEGVVFGETTYMSQEDMALNKYTDMPFPHPSMFVRKKVYEAIGLYSLQFRLSADYDFVLRVLESEYKGLPLAEHTGKFRVGGESGGFETFIDTKNVLLSHNVPKILVYKNMWISILKVLLLKYVPNLSSIFRKKFRKKSRHLEFTKEKK